MSESTPRRRLHVGHAMAVCVGMVIGSGIFMATPSVAANVDGVGMLALAWLIGGAVSIVGALCFAELASTYPDAGGDYQFLRRAFGEHLGYLFAWSRFAVIHTGSTAALAFTFGDYLAQVAGFGVHGSALAGGCALLVLVALNLAGVAFSVGTQLGLMAVVIGGMLAIGAAGLFHAATGMPAGLPGGTPAAAADAAPMFGLAMIFVLFAYGGWSDAATLSSEMRDARRGIVRALVGGMALVTVLYLVVNAGFVQVLGMDGLAASKAPAADVMQVTFGPLAEVAIVAVVAITAITTMNALIIAGARTTYAACRDLPALRRAGVWDAERGVPRVAVVAQCAVALALIAFGAIERGGFKTMIDYVTPVYWFFLVLSGIAVIVLRRREPDRPRPFQVPLYPWLPLLFCASSGYLLYSSVAYVRTGAMAGVAALAIGAVLIAILVRRGRSA
ncbi:MAG: APC family permease [Xanthomonadaceae bacterium]|jgi:amino acid transporter|nr:APC family permease [Xanthomonadaceae bacterium]